MAMSVEEKKAARRAACKRWYEANRENRSAYAKRYREENREKMAASDKRYVEANREKVKAYHARYREENREKRQAYFKRYREANREERNAVIKRWKEANPEKCRAADARRRAAKAGVVHVPYVDAEVFDRDDWYCQGCGVKTNRDGDWFSHPLYPNKDHIIPLNKGGHDALYNLQTLCRKCNGSKHTKDNDEFMKGFA